MEFSKVFHVRKAAQEDLAFPSNFASMCKRNIPGAGSMNGQNFDRKFRIAVFMEWTDGKLEKR